MALNRRLAAQNRLDDLRVVVAQRQCAHEDGSRFDKLAPVVRFLLSSVLALAHAAAAEARDALDEFLAVEHRRAVVEHSSFVLIAFALFVGAVVAQRKAAAIQTTFEQRNGNVGVGQLDVTEDSAEFFDGFVAVVATTILEVVRKRDAINIHRIEFLERAEIRVGERIDSDSRVEKLLSTKAKLFGLNTVRKRRRSRRAVRSVFVVTVPQSVRRKRVHSDVRRVRRRKSVCGVGVLVPVAKSAVHVIRLAVSRSLVSGDQFVVSITRDLLCGGALFVGHHRVLVATKIMNQTMPCSDFD